MVPEMILTCKSRGGVNVVSLDVADFVFIIFADLQIALASDKHIGACNSAPASGAGATHGST